MNLKMFEAMYVSSSIIRTNFLNGMTVTKQKLSMVGGYMEDLAKSQNCQNWWVSTCTEMGACTGHYSVMVPKFPEIMPNTHWLFEAI